MARRHHDTDSEIATNSDRTLDHLPCRRRAVCPSIKMIRVEATLSARRNSVVNNRMVGNAANSSVRWVNIATSNTMIDKAILKGEATRSVNAGSCLLHHRQDQQDQNRSGKGSAIVSISGLRASAASQPLISRRSVFLVNKIQGFRHRKMWWVGHQGAVQQPDASVSVARPRPALPPPRRTVDPGFVDQSPHHR